jgi:putative transposase
VLLEDASTSVLSSLPDATRSLALARFHTIRPFLEEGVSLAAIAREHGIVLRTARRWVKHYRRDGLAGLARKERNDKDRRKLSPTLQQAIEGLALRKPRLSAAAIYRKTSEVAKSLGERVPS